MFDWDNISDMVLAHAARRPDAEAVRSGQMVLTWAGLAQCTEDATAFLDGHGIVAGEVVGLALSNTIEHVILLLALMRLGATPLGFPPETPPDQLAAVVRTLNVRVLFREPQEHQMLAPLTIPLPPHWRPERGGRHRRTTLTAERLQLVFLSSGSTGTPRTVALTQEALLQRARLSYPVHARWWSENDPGTALVAGSIAHAAFIQWWLQQMILGGRTVLLPLYVRGGDLLREMAQWDEAVLRTVPNTCRLFLQAAPEDGLLLPRMRLLNCTGLPLHPHEKRELRRLVTPNFTEDYGASGVGPITCLLPEDVDAKGDSVGRAPDSVEIRLCDGTGRMVPSGAAGRLLVRSPGMAPRPLQDQYQGNGYEGFEDGWYRTGDVGRLDDEGFLHFVGRAGHSIRQNGEELYPEEIEAALSSFPGIGDVAVVGLVRPGQAHEVAVAVIGGVAYEQRFAVEEHCADRLPSGRRPANYLFTDHLPYTANGKIDRPAIRAYLEANPSALPS